MSEAANDNAAVQGEVAADAALSSSSQPEDEVLRRPTTATSDLQPVSENKQKTNTDAGKPFKKSASRLLNSQVLRSHETPKATDGNVQHKKVDKSGPQVSSEYSIRDEIRSFTDFVQTVKIDQPTAKALAKKLESDSVEQVNKNGVGNGVCTEEDNLLVNNGPSVNEKQDLTSDMEKEITAYVSHGSNVDEVAKKCIADEVPVTSDSNHFQDDHIGKTGSEKDSNIQRTAVVEQMSVQDEQEQMDGTNVKDKDLVKHKAKSRSSGSRSPKGHKVSSIHGMIKTDRRATARRSKKEGTNFTLPGLPVPSKIHPRWPRVNSPVFKNEMESGSKPVSNLLGIVKSQEAHIRAVVDSTLAVDRFGVNSILAPSKFHEGGDAANSAWNELERNDSEGCGVPLASDVQFLDTRNDEKLERVKVNQDNSLETNRIALVENTQSGDSSKKFSSTGNTVRAGTAETEISPAELGKSQELSDVVAVERSASTLAGSNLKNKLKHYIDEGQWSLVENMLRYVDRKEFNPEEITDQDGNPLILSAIKNNRINVIQQLLDLHANLNISAKDGYKAGHVAAKWSNFDTLCFLISKGVSVDTTTQSLNQLPLHLAAGRKVTPSFNSNIMVQLLMKETKVADGVNTRLIEDANGCIAFVLACEAENIQLCKELLTINGREQDSGNTAMHIACLKGNVELLKLISEYEPLVDEQNNRGQTPLFIASANGAMGLLRILYRLEADPKICDKDGKTPIHVATEHGRTSIVEILADKFHASVLARTNDGSTMMHIASLFGHDQTAMVFLKRGVPLQMPNRNGLQALHCAAMHGHLTVVKALLKKGCPIDFKTKDGHSPLHLAVQAGKPDVVEFLLGSGADVHLISNNGETPLHIAAGMDDKNARLCADMLLKSGVHVNAALENGETALHLATRKGNIHMVQLLLDEEADPLLTSKIGKSALHIAAECCFYEVAAMFVDCIEKSKGRELAVKLVKMQTKDGYSALHYAAEGTTDEFHQEGEDVSLANLLLDYESDISVTTYVTLETVLHSCAKSGNFNILGCIVSKVGLGGLQLALNQQDKNGWPPLSVACYYGHEKVVEALLKYTARLDVFDEFGRTPLHLAAERGHVALCDILIRHRAFINSKTKLGYTPLHYAAKFGHQKLFDLLVQQHRAPTDVVTMENQTPLHIAAKYGQISICRALLELHANSAVRDIRGRTPLHLAAENDHPEIVHLFLTKSSNEGTLDITDENGLTCAHIAALKGSLAVIKGLMTIDRNMVVNAKTKADTSSTALHMAAAGGHTAIVRVLLEGGASPLEENSQGMAALHLAAEHGHVDILNVIDKEYWKICSRKTGLNALHVAAYHGQKEFVRNILVNVSATSKSEPPGEYNPLIVKEMASEYCLTPLHMAAQSEHEGLIRLLLNVPGVQVDIPTETMNIVPLHLAAHSGHLAVVGQLLSRGTQQISARDYKGRTPLHIAASEGHFETVSLLLSQGANINIMDQNGWTPMHFATKAGHLKLIKFLIERGADPAAECLEGKIPMCFAASDNRVDCLMYLLKQKHDTYQLMENKKFIFDIMVCGKNHQNKPIEEFIMNSAAPINTAINLSSLYKAFAAKEKERARDLNLMAEFCECIAVELMSITASEFNPALILKSLDRQGQPLIDVLIEHNQKAVVSHPSVQRYLTEVWNGGIRWNFWRFIVFFCLIMFCFPAWVFFALPFNFRLCKAPVIKFVCHLVSHIYFTLLLTLEVLCVLQPIYEMSSPIPNWFEWILLLWISGQLVSELSPFGGNSFGFIRLIIIFLSGMATVIHLIAFIYPSIFMRHSPNETKLHFVRSVLYLQNQMMAVALLTSFVEFLEFLTVHHLFGPWAIIIRDLMYDLARFLVILFLFMAGFTVTVASIYQPAFPASTSGAPANHISILTIAQLLFFSLFGQVTVDNMPPIAFSPSLGTTIIKIVYGIYLIVSIIVLINLLIAMMSDTYQRIQAQSDAEWKFGRAKLIRQMNKKSSTPPPVNLFTKCYVLLKVAFRNRCLLYSKTAQKDFIVEENEDVYSLGEANLHLIPEKRQDAGSAPEVETGKNAQRRIEDVIDWKRVAKLYYVYQGSDEHHAGAEETIVADNDATRNKTLLDY